MPVKKKPDLKKAPTRPKPFPPGLTPIDPTHFRAVPIIGTIDCKK